MIKLYLYCSLIQCRLRETISRLHLYLRTTKNVIQRDINGLFRWAYPRGLSPKEIARLVIIHGCLIRFHVKNMARHAYRSRIGIVSIKIRFRFIIFPIYGLIRCPRRIVNKTHIVHVIPCILQITSLLPVIIHNIQSNLVTSFESGICCPCNILYAKKHFNFFPYRLRCRLWRWLRISTTGSSRTCI